MQRAADKIFAQCSHARLRFGQLRPRDGERLRHADDAGHIDGAAAQAALLFAPRHEGRNAHPLAHIQRAHSFRPVKFMGGDAQQIDGRRIHIQNIGPRRLHCVAEEQHAPLAAEAGNLGERLHGARLVVDRHDGGENGIPAQQSRKGGEVEHAVRPDGRRGDCKPFLCEQPRGRTHGGMFDGGDDDVPAPPGIGVHRTAQRPVIRLGPAGGEIDLLRLGAEQGSDGIARGIHSGDRPPPEGVQRMGVAEMIGKAGQHLLQHARVDGRRCGVIQINALHAAPHAEWRHLQMPSVP